MFEGLGLGLFISADIIRKDHGQIWEESKEGEGSIFGFSLPLSL
jgi:signal transduction histidine kinase